MAKTFYYLAVTIFGIFGFIQFVHGLGEWIFYFLALSCVANYKLYFVIGTCCWFMLISQRRFLWFLDVIYKQIGFLRLNIAEF